MALDLFLSLVEDVGAVAVVVMSSSSASSSRSSSSSSSFFLFLPLVFGFKLGLGAAMFLEEEGVEDVEGSVAARWIDV